MAATFLQTSLLVLLAEKPDHGYGLARRLEDFGLTDIDPGRIYRALRQLERDGSLGSDWSATGTGPARRSYRVTTEGLAELDRRIDRLRKLRKDIELVLGRYAETPAAGTGTQDTLCAQPHVPGQREPDLVTTARR